ncbi:hypothetical protein C8J57DRAFT_1245534 [Mycena rebaudengoi]|nr:hypothetical protein C8J57DRAFT_1245534 [Mycena rebaudengoi]
MPPKEGALWEFFSKGPKQNASINEAYYPPNNTDLVLKDRLKWEEAAFTAAHEESGHVRGEKSAMITHLNCVHMGHPWPEEKLHRSRVDHIFRHCANLKKTKEVVLQCQEGHEEAGTGGANIPFSLAEIEHVGDQFLRDAKRGHKDLGLKQPRIFVVPYCAHQYSHSTKGQLILSDYLAVNEEASVVAEQATDLIHWILSHDRVHKIFDHAQPENNLVVLVYPLANITWWTTHYVAFHCLLDLKAPHWHTAYLRWEEIIKAQLGSEQNRKAVKKITESANAQCNLLENTHFWPSLQTLVDDIEPICYATNINQANNMQGDQVLLTFAGLYRRFAQHSNKTVSKGMLAQLEKRWAALD